MGFLASHMTIDTHNYVRTSGGFSPSVQFALVIPIVIIITAALQFDEAGEVSG